MTDRQLEALRKRWELRMKYAWLASLEQIKKEMKAKNIIPGSHEAQQLIASEVGAWFQGGWIQVMTITAASTGEQLRSLGVRTAFDGTSRRTIAALQEHRLRLVQGFTQEQTQVAQTAIHRGLLDGRNPVAQAREFRENIGLTPKQEAIVSNYRRLLTNQDRAALDRKLRDARFDSTVDRSITSGVKLTPDQIDKMVGRYRERMVKLRAETIARTESMRALSTGQDAMYRQAVEEGTLGKDEVELEWVTAKDERVRPSHMVMDGQRRKIGEPFVTGLGNLLYYPRDPFGVAEDTIECRCERAPRHRLFAQVHPPKQGVQPQVGVSILAGKSIGEHIEEVRKALASAPA